jgi:hypothetical protein
VLSLSILACRFDRSGLDSVDAALVRRDGTAGADGAAGNGDGADLRPDTIIAVDAPDAADASDGSEGGSVSVVGCADGTREGYVSLQNYPEIAACAGGWSVAGLLADITRTPTCDRQAGNAPGAITDGSGCTVADLCAEGWHVCETAREVVDLAGDCSDAFTSGTFVFYVTRQRAFLSLCSDTNSTGTTNLHGCGNFGSPEDSSCAPFTRMLTDIDCTAFPPWRCASATVREYEAVTKSGSTRGGVLCCRD